MRLTLSFRSVLASVSLVGLGMLASPGSWHSSPHSDSPNLEALAALAPQDIEHLQVFLKHMSIVQMDTGDRTAPFAREGSPNFSGPIGATATTIRFTGVNLQIVNGLNATNGFPRNRLRGPWRT